MAQKHQAVFTERAPTPLPQFSQAVILNGIVYCSGNIGVLPGTNFEQVEGTVKDRTVCDNLFGNVYLMMSTDHVQRQALKNISAVLEASGCSLQTVVKMNIYITKMSNFGLVNEAYDEFFTWDLKPVSTSLGNIELFDKSG